MTKSRPHRLQTAIPENSGGLSGKNRRITTRNPGKSPTPATNIHTKIPIPPHRGRHPAMDTLREPSPRQAPDKGQTDTISRTGPLAASIPAPTQASSPGNEHPACILLQRQGRPAKAALPATGPQPAVRTPQRHPPGGRTSLIRRYRTVAVRPYRAQVPRHFVDRNTQ